MSKSLIIDHLVGVYCPMVAQEAEKNAHLRRFTGQVTQLLYSLEAAWTLSSMYRSHLTLSQYSTKRLANKAFQAPPGSP